MKLFSIKFLFVNLFVLNSWCVYAISDTIVVTFESNQEKIKILKETNPTIIRQGEVLTVELGEIQTPVDVRLHSSLGRVVKQFRGVLKPVYIETNKLQPGVYLIVIKRPEAREIRKVLITEPD